MSHTTVARLFAPLEVKARDDAARTFEGLAAAYSLDHGGDVIHPGAFKRTLDHWKTSGRTLPLLDQHAMSLNPTHSVTQHTLGKLLDAEERDGGLWARFQVAKTRAGDDLLALLKDGMVEGLSIGYQPINPQRDDSGVRHLKEVRLHEVSVVTYGMNPDALIELSSVKSITEALKAGTLSDDEKAEIRALLDPPADPPPPASEPAQYAKTDALAMRIRLAKLRSPAIRTSAVRHAEANTPQNREAAP